MSVQVHLPGSGRSRVLVFLVMQMHGSKEQTAEMLAEHKRKMSMVASSGGEDAQRRRDELEARVAARKRLQKEKEKNEAVNEKVKQAVEVQVGRIVFVEVQVGRIGFVEVQVGRIVFVEVQVGRIVFEKEWKHLSYFAPLLLQS